MATEKHPLSGLFNEKRKQAQAFRRDLVTRASARQGGQWGVVAQETLPAEATNMGRLASSLASVSGLLAQYNNFQLAKEQEAQKGKAIEHQIAVQGLQQKQLGQSIAQAGLRGQQIDQRILQQEIATETAQTKASDAEWDNWWSGLTLDEQEEHMNQADVAAKAMAAERDMAEANIDAVVGPTYRRGDHPLGEVRAMRRMGASMAHDYAQFFAQRMDELREGIRESATPGLLSTDVAEDKVRGILDEYLASKEIDPDSEVGRGLLMAVGGLNAKAMPLAEQTLLDESERLGDINLQTSLDALDMSPPSLPIPSSENDAYENEAPLPGSQEAFMKQALDLTKEDRERVEEALAAEGLGIDKLHKSWPLVDERDLRRGIEIIEAVTDEDKAVAPKITDHPAVKELQGKTSAEIMKILMGVPGNPGIGKEGFLGLIDIMGKNEIGAKKFQLLLDELSEVLTVDGKLLKDHMHFGNMVAEAEENIQKAITGEVNKARAVAERAMDNVSTPVADTAAGWTKEEITDVSNKLTIGASLVEREVLIELFPSLEKDIRELPENAYYDYVAKIRKTIEQVGTHKEAGQNAWLINHIPSYLKLNGAEGLTGVLLDIKNSGVSGEVKNDIERYLEAGQGQAQEMPLSTKRITASGISLVNKENNSAVVAYTRELDRLFTRITREKGRDYLSTEEGEKLVGEELKKIDQEFKEALMKSLTIKAEEEIASNAPLDEMEKARRGQFSEEAAKGLKDPTAREQWDLVAAENGAWWKIWDPTRGGVIPHDIRQEKEGKKPLIKMGAMLADVFELKPFEKLPINLEGSKAVLDAHSPVDKTQAKSYITNFHLTEQAYKEDVAPFFDVKAEGSEFGELKERELRSGGLVSFEEAMQKTGTFFGRILLADKHLPSIQQRRVALSSLADKVNGVGVYMGRESKTVEEYHAQTAELQMRVRRKNALSVEGGINRVWELVSAQEITGGDYIAHEAEKWLGQDVSLFKKGFDKHSRDENGEMTTGWKWTAEKRNVTLAEDHFSTQKPVIKGLPLQNRSISGVISETEIKSKGQLQKIAKAYGFSTIQSFLNYQYGHPYYKALQQNP